MYVTMQRSGYWFCIGVKFHAQL